MTYKRSDDMDVEEEWEDDEAEDLEEWEDLDLEDEEDELWIDDDEY